MATEKQTGAGARGNGDGRDPRPEGDPLTPGAKPAEEPTFSRARRPRENRRACEVNRVLFGPVGHPDPDLCRLTGNVIRKADGHDYLEYETTDGVRVVGSVPFR